MSTAQVANKKPNIVNVPALDGSKVDALQISFLYQSCLLAVSWSPGFRSRCSLKSRSSKGRANRN